MIISIRPIQTFNGVFDIPPSKPETQRAILAAALASGTSLITHDLRCLETILMKNAIKTMGAQVIEQAQKLEIHGCANNPIFADSSIECAGSALVFRIFAALATHSQHPINLKADGTLSKRIMKPLFDALMSLGGKYDFGQAPSKAPCCVLPSRLCGGVCHLPGNISSQFITSLLFFGPLLNDALEIHVDFPPHSSSYIKQTLHTLALAGVNVEYNNQLTFLKTLPSKFRSFNVNIDGDFTSASYLLGCAILFPGKTVFNNINIRSLQGEAIILDLLSALDMKFSFSEEKKQLTIDNQLDTLRGDIEINVKNGPNITPTLAAIGAYITGSFTVRGAKLCQYHKSPRIEVIVYELKKLGVDISLIYDENNICDGFTVRGKASYTGGATFNSHNDHRILMSLYVAALKANSPCQIKTSGLSSVKTSFPDFFNIITSTKRLAKNEYTSI